MKPIYSLLLLISLVSIVSCSMLGSEPYGYAWMRFNNISFGLGELDRADATVEGVACRVDGNRTMYADLEFRYKFFHDANGDRKCQPSEVLAQQARKFAPGNQEIHIEDVSLSRSTPDVHVFLGIYEGATNLATYQGGFQF